MNIIVALFIPTLVLASGPESPPQQVGRSETHLHRATPCPKLDVFRALAHPDINCLHESLHHMDINETNQEGDTPLHAAIHLRRKNAIRVLIKEGADLSLRNDRQETPRDLAEKYGYNRLAAYLGGIERETERLILAVDKDDLLAVSASLLRGASIGTRDSRRDTPLHLAAQSNLPEVSALLLQSGAKVDARNYLGETPLHQAAMRDFSATMKVLLEHGANPSALNYRRETPFDFALAHFTPEVMKLFKGKHARRGSRADIDLVMSGGEGMDLEASSPATPR